MTLGEKVHYLRCQRGMTQSVLASDRMTRNMLSRIEHGQAVPSFQNLQYIAERLSISPAYFFEDGKDLLYYDCQRDLPEVRKLHNEGRFGACIRLAELYKDVDNMEISAILHDCYYHLALDFFDAGDFPSSRMYFDLADSVSPALIMPGVYKIRSTFYRQIIDALSEGRKTTPAIVTLSIASETDDYPDLLIYQFLISLIDSDQAEKASIIYDTVRLKSDIYRSHFNARLAASLKNYERAKELLLSIIDGGNCVSSPILYTVYDDLERYSKATDDYKTAYRCSLEKAKFSFKK